MQLRAEIAEHTVKCPNVTRIEASMAALRTETNQGLTKVHSRLDDVMKNLMKMQAQIDQYAQRERRGG